MYTRGTVRRLCASHIVFLRAPRLFRLLRPQEGVPVEGNYLLVFHTPFCDREIQQVPVLPALNRAAPPCAGWVSASRYRASARSSCSSSPGPSPRGQLKQGSSESALAPSDRGRTQQSEDGNGSVPRPEAQELHNFGAKPAANFSANDDEAASTERPTSKCTLAAREKQI